MCTLATLYLGYKSYKNDRIIDENKVKIETLETKLLKLSKEFESTKKH